MKTITAHSIRLIGPALAWAVASALQMKPTIQMPTIPGVPPVVMVNRDTAYVAHINGNQLLLLIKNHISELRDLVDEGWTATCNGVTVTDCDDPAIAVCRAIVLSMLGATVDLPIELQAYSGREQPELADASA